MCHTPLISIIIPVYNVGNLLKTCLDSVLCQTYQNFEIILIDDGSTDNSLQTIESLIVTDSRICVFQQVNQGAASARNLGIEHSRGDYLFFLDADDTISPDAIEYLFKLLQSTNSQVAASGIAYYNQFGKIYKKSSFQQGVYTVSEVLEMLYTHSTELCLIGGKMVKRQCLGELRFVSGQLVEDACFVPQLYIKVGKIALSSKINYHYYTGRTDSVSKEISIKKIADHLESLHLIRSLLKTNKRLVSIVSARIFEIRGNYLKKSCINRNKEAFNYSKDYSWSGFYDVPINKKIKFITIFIILIIINYLNAPILVRFLVNVKQILTVKITFKNIKKQYDVFKRGYKQVKRIGYFADSAYRYFLFPKTKVVYIDNSKVASTSIKEMLVTQEGDNIFELFKNDIHIHCQQYYMKDMDGDTVFPYFSFVFVRNPFERVVSTYKNMYKKQKRQWSTFKTYLFGYFKKDKGFAYFVKKGPVHISDKWADTHLISQHILVYGKDGKPYVDFIGRFENLSVEWKKLQDKIDLPELPFRNQTEKDDWRDYYTKELAQLVYTRYQRDFEVFGYDDEYQKLLNYLDEKCQIEKESSQK